MYRLNAFQVEAAWKLGRWGDLEQYLKAVSVSLLCHRDFIEGCFCIGVGGVCTVFHFSADFRGMYFMPLHVLPLFILLNQRCISPILGF